MRGAPHKGLKTRRKKSEVHPDPKFHGARESSFCRKLPKRLWVLPGYVEIRVQQLVVVQNIDEINRSLGTEALRDSEVFLYAQVHVPVRQPAELPEAAAVAIEAQDQRANVAEYGRGIREHVGDHLGAGWRCHLNVVKRRACSGSGGQHAVRVCPDISTVPGTEILRTCVPFRRKTSRIGVTKIRGTAACGEDRGKGPTAQKVSEHTLLIAIVGRLVDEEHRIHELAIEDLWAVLVIQVKRINGSLLTRGLNHRSCPQRPTVGEVIL